MKEKYLTLPCIIRPNGTTEINKRRGTNCFVSLFTFFSYRPISCQIYISRPSAYVARTPYTRRDLFVQPPNDSGWVKAAPPLPANGPAAFQPAIVAPPPSPGASLRAANQAAGRGQRRPAGLRPTPNHRLFNGPSPKSDLQSANHTFHSTLGTTSKISAFRSFIYKITHEIIWLIVIGGGAGQPFFYKTEIIQAANKYLRTKMYPSRLTDVIKTRLLPKQKCPIALERMTETELTLTNN